MNPTDPDLTALGALAVEIATEAGEMLARGLDDTRTLVETKSTATDMVTEMDRASEVLIVERIQAVRPHDAIRGEEGTDHPGTDAAERDQPSSIRWVIDPLDGTTNYLYRLPGWSVSIGVELDGEPVAGAVVVPAMGDVFAATAGHGATHNGGTLAAAEPVPLASALVGTGFNYDPEVRATQGAHLTALLPKVRDIRRFGAAAADLCNLAAGRLDAYFEAGLEHWDRCAGTVIAREAGYRVETTDDHPLPGILTVATHPESWDEFCRLLRETGPMAS